MDLTENKVIDKMIKKTNDIYAIDNNLYDVHSVKKGLRNDDGTGVLAGLTQVGDVKGYERTGDTIEPCDGELYYRGHNIADLVHRVEKEDRCGFEEIVFLLLSGNLPTSEELKEISAHLNERLTLTPHEKMTLINHCGPDVMNMMALGVLAMYSNDSSPEPGDTQNVMRQSLDLIARLPLILVYAYQAKHHSLSGKNLSIRIPLKNVSHAENILYLLKGGSRYTQLEIRLLDLMLMIHAEHGGGNNSTFTTRVTASSGTDSYSIISAALASLKGPLHGGAASTCAKMLNYLKEEIKDWSDETEIKKVLQGILQKEGFDKSGKIYGLGHAVYTKSDPRANLLREQAGRLAKEKNKEDEYLFYKTVEKISIQMLEERNNKPCSSNVDFYSGFVYSCLEIPLELYTPLFATSRIAGWSAHRMEEWFSNQKKIIRPAYKSVATFNKPTAN